jgi:thiosulfate dehydrogenase
MKGFLGGIVVTLVLILLSGVLYIRSGWMPVAVSDPPLLFEKQLARLGVHSRVKRDAPVMDAFAFTIRDGISGARVYQQDCAFCHGLPEQRAAIGNAMFPRAPQLFPDRTVTDDPVGVIYWKIKNGIRLTGMPAFKASLTEQQMWQVSTLLARADKLPPQVLDAFKPPSANAAAPASVTPAPAQTK